MKILLLGSGGREHALARALTRDPSVLLITAPGNPGTAQCGENVDLHILDGAAVAEFALERGVELVVVGPEAPLVAGVADVIRKAGIPVFGPNRAAALLEGSKAFAKDVMHSAGVPTAEAVVCESLPQVESALDRFGAPYVVKDDGLAAGKGVVVTENRELALAHATACLRKTGGSVVIEEFLDGPEVSLFCVCDGERALPLQAAQDFKRAYDENRGPNTGGMGAYSPLPWLEDGLTQEVVSRVAQPVLVEMNKRGTPFIGLLYCGLALTSRGLKVVEFNVRFGDPETQVVLPLLETPLHEVLFAAAQGNLDGVELTWSQGAAVTVVLAAHGYPGEVKLGDPITCVEAAEAWEGAHVIHAGTRMEDRSLVSAGGRVLCLVGEGKDVASARAHAYAALAEVSLPGSHHRSDIAAGM